MKFLQTLLNIPQAPIPTSATEPVPKGSLNAIRTTWMAPSTVTTVEQAAADVKAAFEAYPQEGQAGIDKGGWEVAADGGGSLDSSKFRVEFTSGRGFFAKLLNGGEGFKDDVLVEIFQQDPLRVEVRSSSRMGKSDMGVNQKRLQFLADKMRLSSWDAPKPEYSTK